MNPEINPKINQKIQDSEVKSETFRKMEIARLERKMQEIAEQLSSHFHTLDAMQEGFGRLRDLEGKYDCMNAMMQLEAAIKRLARP